MSDLIQREQESLKAAAEHYSARDGGGHVFMYQCQTCGWLNWFCTQTDKQPGFTVQPAEDCPKCREVYLRSPEAMQWVINAIAMSELRIEKSAAEIGRNKEQGDGGGV